MPPKGTLSLEGLAKNYGAKQAVREVTFSMESGEVVGLLGPNGAGKTTVFYMVVGFIRPTSGRIWLDGRDVTGLPMYRRARLGISYLPQEPSVFRKLSVEDNIAAILETRPAMSGREQRAKLDELLDELGIRHLRGRRPGPSRAASAGARRSPDRWPSSPSSSCSTSRSRASTRSRSRS